MMKTNKNMLKFTDRIMGTSYNTQTPPVLSKINKEKNYNYKASHSPWGNKKPLLTSCSLHIHILYIIISFFREAKHICLPDTGYQLSVRVFFTSGRQPQVLGPNVFLVYASKDHQILFLYIFNTGKLTQCVRHYLLKLSVQPSRNSYSFYCTPRSSNHDWCN